MLGDTSSAPVVQHVLVKHVACMGERRSIYRVLVGKTEGKRPFGKPRRRWEDNIKMDF